MAEITRHESKQFLRDIDPNHPSHVYENTKKARYKSKVVANVELVDAHPPSHKQLTLEYFKVAKFENVAESLMGMSKGWENNRGQFELCFNVRGKNDVKILFDTVQVSEYLEKLNKRHVLKKEHLTPLEEAFDEGIALAKSVLDEMHYMEKREIRMKQTTDGTNARIRYFSYLSIVILLAVTYVQISYLKNYFKKKKVL